MHKYLISCFAAFTFAVSASAVEYVSPAPGSLKDAFTEPKNVLVLDVKGSVDASDLFFISENMPELTSLNLADASIAPYNGAAIQGVGKYDASLIPAGVFAGTKIENIVLPSAGNITVGEMAFAGSAVKKLSVSAPNIVIADGAFSSCPQLKTVVLTGVKLSDYVFANCPVLETVTLSNISAVPAASFAACPSLDQVDGLAAVASVGEKAFAGCSALTGVTFGPKLRTIGSAAFKNSGLENLALENCSALDSIGAWAFADCAHLENAHLGDAVKFVGEGAFFDCPALENVYFPQNISELSPYIFKGNASLASSDMVNGNTATIGDYALMGMTSLEEVKLPAALTYIGKGAMEGTTGLRRIHAEDTESVPELGDDVWAGINPQDVELYILSTQYDDYHNAAQWQDFKFMVSTAEPGVVTEAPTQVAVEGRFVGQNLELRSRGADINVVDIYLTSGSLAMRETPRAVEATLNTSSIAGNIFIVECTLSDNSRATLKLIRR